MSRKITLFFALFSLVVGSKNPAVAGVPDDRIPVPSTLVSATVYRNGAELVHQARATLRQGNNELGIEDISNKIDINSVRISSTGNNTVMSVEFSTEYLQPETKSALAKKLGDSLEFVNKELEKIAVLTRTDHDLLDLLASNKKIGGAQSGVSVAELIKMMDYYKQKSLELENELSAYKEKESRWKQMTERLENQIGEEERKNAKTSGRLLVQLLSPEGGPTDFTISYLTPMAYWNPSYDLKVESISKPLTLVYKAKLVQTSGIDWKKVKLTLSTSVPNQDGNAPVLKTWFLSLVDPVARMEEYYKSNLASTNTIQSFNANSSDRLQLKSDAPGALKKVIIRGYASDSEAATPLYLVNGREMDAEAYKKINPADIKKIDVLKDAAATSLYGSRAANGVILITLKDELGDYVTVGDNEMNVVFNIDIPYDIPGNGKEQSVELKDYNVPVNYKYYSAPRLNKDAFLLGELSDWGKLNLLPGEANIIFEGTYIGKSYIDPNSTQDTLNLTLGRDKRVVVTREKLVDFSSVKFLGSNKRQVFTYELTVKNNKKEKVQLLLKDQYPISTNKDIEEELLESSGAAVNGETGVLTWKVELAPGESKKYRISYSLKYPKDKELSTY
jgi:TonB-dependent SusC/RagA subfamily outer membrane receptor